MQLFYGCRAENNNVVDNHIILKDKTKTEETGMNKISRNMLEEEKMLEDKLIHNNKMITQQVKHLSDHNKITATIATPAIIVATVKTHF